MNAEAKLLRLERRFMVLCLLMVLQMAGTLIFWSASPATGAAPPKPALGLSKLHPLPKLYITDLYVRSASVEYKLDLSPFAQRWLDRNRSSYQRYRSVK